MDMKNEPQKSHFKDVPSLSPSRSVKFALFSLPAELKALYDSVKRHHLHLQGMGTTQMSQGRKGNLPPAIQPQTEAPIHM